MVADTRKLAVSSGDWHGSACRDASVSLRSVREAIDSESKHSAGSCMSHAYLCSGLVSHVHVYTQGYPCVCDTVCTCTST